MSANFTDNPLFKHRDKGVANKMLVISDGDIIRNEVDSVKSRTGEVKAFSIRLGLDRYDKRIRYGNQEFFVNAMESLLEIEGLKSIRSKSIKFRPVNKAKIGAERSFWKTVNIGLPIFIILIYGLIHAIIRKKRFV
jgi:ABC-2 type transport system permease protein